MLGFHPPPHPPHPPEQTPPEQTPPGADTPPEADTPPRADPLPEQTPPRSRPPPGSRLQHTVYEWPVRILLECILISTENTAFLCNAVIFLTGPGSRIIRTHLCHVHEAPTGRIFNLWWHTRCISFQGRVSTGSRGFHKLDENGNNGNFGIRGFTTRKQKKKSVTKVTRSENRTQASHEPLIPSPRLSSDILGPTHTK